MNNNRGDYPAIHGMQLKEMLLEVWQQPDRAELVQRLEERRAKDRQAHPAMVRVSAELDEIIDILDASDDDC